MQVAEGILIREVKRLFTLLCHCTDIGEYCQRVHVLYGYRRMAQDSALTVSVPQRYYGPYRARESKKEGKIGNRYLTQDTNGKVTTSR